MIQENPELQTLEGTIEKVMFRNAENGYTVAVLKHKNEDIIVVGELLYIDEGDVVSLNGEYTVHSVYGQQFKVSCCEKKMPTTAAAILRYLSSGSIRGVGPSTAQRIVERFGEESLNVIEHYPEQLSVIRGISLDKANAISEEYKKQFGVREIMLLLGQFGVSATQAINVYKALGGNATALVKDNPYLLCGENIGLSFEFVESIAEQFGIEPMNRNRICAGIEYVLHKNLLNGHTCLPKVKLVDVSSKLLRCESDEIERCIDILTEHFKLNSREIRDSEFIALSEYYTAETYIASKITALKNFSRQIIPVSELEIDYVEKEMGISLDKTQREAVIKAAENGVFILTGGPGTGKTTTLNAIISLFERRDILVELAAPTGRAAKRMSELTGRTAKTLHRLLEVEWGNGDKHRFAKNEKNPLSCEAIIIDEMSMVDSVLFEGLLRALRLGCRVIMVGDVDQLPSVGAGNVLNDLIDSGCFETVKLYKIFRQAGKSDIVNAAHAIIDGEPINISNQNTDFFFLRKNSADEILATLLELYTKRLPEKYGFVPKSDIQILCPSRKTELGTVNLNRCLQAEINPPEKSREIYFKGNYFRENDKVMQIKNNYDIVWTRDNGEVGTGIYNGDIGTIETLSKRDGYITVRFDDRVVTYYSEEFSEFELAYAATIHKSQGSEFDCVIVPLFDTPEPLKYRNLLYTAVTRARKLLIILGSETIFNQMIANNKKTLRYTMLKTAVEENNDR